MSYCPNCAASEKEIERLQAELASIHEMHRLERLGDEERVEELQAELAVQNEKLHQSRIDVRLAHEFDTKRVRQIEVLEKELEQAKTRLDLSQPNPNVFVPNTTTDGTGNSEAFRELASLDRIRELESANARLEGEVERLMLLRAPDVKKCRDDLRAAEQREARLREALTKLKNEASGFLSMAEGSEAGVYAHGVTNMRVLRLRIDEAEAALTVQPAPPASAHVICSMCRDVLKEMEPKYALERIQEEIQNVPDAKGKL